MTTQPIWPAMSAEQHRAYAAELLTEHATEFEPLAIAECAQDSPHVPGDEISQADCDAVYEQIRAARVAVNWPPSTAGEHGRRDGLIAWLTRASWVPCREADDIPAEAIDSVAALLRGKIEAIADALIAREDAAEVTARPAAELAQAQPTAAAAGEIGVHQLALPELAQQVYAIAHDVDADLVGPTDDGVPEILAALQAHETGLEDAIIADLATVLGLPTDAGEERVGDAIVRSFSAARQLDRTEQTVAVLRRRIRAARHLLDQHDQPDGVGSLIEAVDRVLHFGVLPDGASVDASSATAEPSEAGQ